MMTDKKNHQSSKKHGPQLLAMFYVSEKGVAKVTLHQPLKNEGFEYKIIEQQPSQYVKQLLEKWIESYCKGRQPSVIPPVDLEGLPPYTTRVLSVLREIPLGLTLTYKELAEITDNPLGARAVGNACARNRCPLIIPCHRVLAAGGRLGGFSGGIDIKERLLQFEGVDF